MLIIVISKIINDKEEILKLIFNAESLRKDKEVVKSICKYFELESSSDFKLLNNFVDPTLKAYILEIERYG